MAFQMSELEAKQTAVVMAGSEPTLIPSPQSDKAEMLVEELLHPDQNSAVAKM